MYSFSDVYSHRGLEDIVSLQSSSLNELHTLTDSPQREATILKDITHKQQSEIDMLKLKVRMSCLQLEPFHSATLLFLLFP